MKIYFAASIRGGRDDAAVYMQLMVLIKGLGHTVLSEHFASNEGVRKADAKLTEVEIYERDCAWVREADVIIAEVTQPSLGVGYELGLAESLEKPVICLYRPQEGKRLSAMLTGNRRFQVVEYTEVEGLASVLGELLKKI